MTEQTDTAGGADLIAALYGPVARREYETSPDYEKPRLIEYARSLADLDDEGLIRAAETAIYQSAVGGRFRGNAFDGDHCRATMCSSESRRRQVAAGHDEWCSNGSLYQRAYNTVVTQSGYPGMADVVTTCDCESAR